MEAVVGMTELLAQMVTWSVELVRVLGYKGVVFLMFLESTVFPFPSELVMPQAGYLASQKEMNLVAVVLCGTVGSWMGAMLNYVVAWKVGRPFFLKFGKYFFCPPDKFTVVERFFLNHGEIGTFTGRLIPVVRHLISIPAGLARMKLSHFTFYTGLGAGIWVTVLSFIGYMVGENVQKVKEYSHVCTLGVIVTCGLLLVGYSFWYSRVKKHNTVEAS